MSQAMYKNNLEELTELLNLSELLKTPARQLSLGQRMRCEIAASLLHSPDVYKRQQAYELSSKNILYVPTAAIYQLLAANDNPLQVASFFAEHARPAVIACLLYTSRCV